MSYFIRNLTAVDIEINDLGLTVEVGNDVDLRAEPNNAIAISNDLRAFITAGDIIVLDPTDGLTQLSTADSLSVVDSTNSAPYGVVGVAPLLNQLKDVDVPTPTHDYVLTYNSITTKWEPKISQGGSGTPPETCFPFYRADGMLDTIVTVSGLFPFYRSDGTYDPILMGGCN